MPVLKPFKYRLSPTKAQEILLNKTFGCCRFVYNRALETMTGHYQQHKKGLSVYDVCKMLPGWKVEPGTEWLAEVSAMALREKLFDLGTAYKNFFKHKSAYPKFKTRRHKQSFHLSQGTTFDELTSRVKITTFPEGIKIRMDRPLCRGKINTTTVSKTCSGKYFISILVEVGGEYPKPPKPVEARTLGLDMGLTHYLTDSDGNKVENPRTLKKHLVKLRLCQRRLSRRVKGSKRRERARHQVALVYERISNIRNDFLHKLTHSLVENQDHESFAIEDLGIRGMMQNRCLARGISDVSWYEFRRQMEYKCKERGKNLLVIGRFEPSSRLCTCGAINHELTLSDRTWSCKKCGTTHDRDILAARNIRHMAFCYNDSNSTARQADGARGVPTGGRRTENARTQQ